MPKGSGQPRTPRQRRDQVRLGSLPARYSFVLNPYVHERFTRCPQCEAPTRARKLPLVVHVDHSTGPRLVLVNKCCRLCLLCETLIAHKEELEHVVAAAGLGVGREYVVLGTIDRRTWRRGFVGEAQLAEIREHMADFKKYVKVTVIPAHRERSTENAG